MANVPSQHETQQIKGKTYPATTSLNPPLKGKLYPLNINAVNQIPICTPEGKNMVVKAVTVKK